MLSAAREKGSIRVCLVCVKESAFVCVCVRECVGESARSRVCVRERESSFTCVCVCVRGREMERERDSERDILINASPPPQGVRRRASAARRRGKCSRQRATRAPSHLCECVCDRECVCVRLCV